MIKGLSSDGDQYGKRQPISEPALDSVQRAGGQLFLGDVAVAAGYRAGHGHRLVKTSEGRCVALTSARDFERHAELDRHTRNAFPVQRKVENSLIPRRFRDAADRLAGFGLWALGFGLWALGLGMGMGMRGAGSLRGRQTAGLFWNVAGRGKARARRAALKSSLVLCSILKSSVKPVDRLPQLIEAELFTAVTR